MHNMKNRTHNGKLCGDSVNNCTIDDCNSFCPSDREMAFWNCLIKPSIEQLVQLNILKYFNIKVYENCNDVIYDCGDIIFFENSFFKSLKNDNNRHPHDNTSWTQLGTFTEILDSISMEDNFSVFKIPYYVECRESPNCQAFYNRHDVVAIKTDSGNVDSCGNPIHIDQYYISLEDSNVEYPVSSSQWDGPLSMGELLMLGEGSGPINICNIAGSNVPTQDSQMLYCNTDGSLNKSTICSVMNNSIPTE